MLWTLLKSRRGKTEGLRRLDILVLFLPVFFFLNTIFDVLIALYLADLVTSEKRSNLKWKIFSKGCVCGGGGGGGGGGEVNFSLLRLDLFSEGKQTQLTEVASENLSSP